MANEGMRNAVYTVQGQKWQKIDKTSTFSPSFISLMRALINIVQIKLTKLSLPI